MQTLSLWISLVALITSLWTRIEAFVVGVSERRAVRAKRVGEAFAAAQNCKNKLSDLIQTSEGARESLSGAERQAIEEGLVRWRRDYETIKELVKGFEGIVIEFENGRRLSMPASVIEAKIARFNQIRLLAEHDITYIKEMKPALPT